MYYDNLYASCTQSGKCFFCNHTFILFNFLFYNHFLSVSSFLFFSFCLLISDPQEVLQAMRGYVSSFFGCRSCATHFESMAQESIDHVTSLSSAVLWLWIRHNRVNNRLAGQYFQCKQM